MEAKRSPAHAARRIVVFVGLHLIISALAALVLAVVTWPLTAAVAPTLGGNAQILAGTWVVVIPCQTLVVILLVPLAVMGVATGTQHAMWVVRAAVIFLLPSYVTLGILCFIFFAAGAIGAMGTLVLLQAAEVFITVVTLFGLASVIINVWILVSTRVSDAVATHAAARRTGS